MKSSKKFLKFFGLLVILAFVGCREVDLHHNLQEIEADEILVTLHQNGIEAKKEKEMNGQDLSWKVTVGSDEMAKARQILIANNLPRKHELGLSGVYKEKGLIPTPDEQKARFLLALKGEIINSLQKIPGVVDCDVVLNVPTESEFSELDPVKKKPTASVVVKTRNDELVAQTVTEGKIQRFVANTVPNLDPNDVTVIVTRADTGALASPIQNPGIAPTPTLPAPPVAAGEEEPGAIAPQPTDSIELAGIRMDPESVGRFKTYIIGLLSLLVAVSIFLLFNIIRLNRMRLKVQKGSRAPSLAGANPSAGLLGDGQGAVGMDGTFDVGTGERQQM